MKVVSSLLFLIFCLIGLLSEPVFVVASDTCYVDEDADSGGDGSDDEPYQDIGEALDEDCDKIIIAKGVYKDDITISKNVDIIGQKKDEVVITGKVLMKNNSSIREVTIAESGIDVADGADVEIRDAKIENAGIGINTTGNGMLTVKKVDLYDNRKAMYLQRGKNVNITNNNVYDNDEEGIDIRANVDGIISNNEIYNNGESGIEVILGKSDLKIYDNKIKKNGSSGIAAQYYKSANKLGGVKIKDNTITNNKDYGINCKAPSGGDPGVKYWTESIQMTANKVYDNKDGDFSETCYFDAQKIDDAEKTKKEQEAKQKMKAMQDVQKKAIAERQREEQLKIDIEREQLQKEQSRKEKEQEILRNTLQKERELQENVGDILQEVEELYSIDLLAKEKIKNRSPFVTFFIGPDYQELINIAKNINEYNRRIKSANGIKNEITDGEILEQVSEDIISMSQKQEDLIEVVIENKNRFSLFGWLFKKI